MREVWGDEETYVSPNFCVLGIFFGAVAGGENDSWELLMWALLGAMRSTIAVM